MIISVNAGEAFDKIQQPFTIKKTLNKLGIEGNFLNLISTPNIIVNSEIESFHHKISNQRCLLLSLLFNIVLKVLARANRQEKEIKNIQILEE